MVSTLDKHTIDKLYKLYEDDFKLLVYFYDIKKHLAGGWNDLEI